MISPNINTTNVNTPVVTLTKALPHNCNVRVVAREDAAILTRLLPIRIALSILDESEVILRTLWAFLLPSSARERILIWLTVTNDVSADEKKADIMTSTIRTTNCIMTLGSNVFNSFCLNLP